MKPWRDGLVDERLKGTVRSRAEATTPLAVDKARGRKVRLRTVLLSDSYTQMSYMKRASQTVIGFSDTVLVHDAHPRVCSGAFAVQDTVGL